MKFLHSDSLPNFFSSGLIFLAEPAKESWHDLTAVLEMYIYLKKFKVAKKNEIEKHSFFVVFTCLPVIWKEFLSFSCSFAPEFIRENHLWTK